MWVRFERDFRFKPTSQSSQHYRTGTEVNVPQNIADAAMKAGAAVAVKKGKGDKEPAVTKAPQEVPPSGNK